MQMEVSKKVIYLQDSTDTCVVYYITDGDEEIRITYINYEHYETIRSSKHE